MDRLRLPTGTGALAASANGTALLAHGSATFSTLYGDRRHNDHQWRGAGRPAAGA